MKIKFLALAAASAFGLAGAAEATTVDFAYLSGVTPVATGSFTYADALTGVLGYGDLSSFSVTVSSVTYTLADVTPLTDYIHFAYDTAAVAFVTDFNSCGFAGCGYQSSLSAINSSGTFGFFFNGAPGGYQEYSTQVGGSFTSIAFDVTAGVPEPASWALMLTGFGLAGAALRRRTASVAA